MRETREWMTMSGALIAGIGASICCIGPLVLATLGLGGAAIAVSFEPYRPWFILVTAVLLGAGFFQAYRRLPAGACGPDGACEMSARRRRMRSALWIVSLIVLAALTFPYYVIYLV